MRSVMHASLYAENPKRVAEKIAALVGGRTTTFHPVRGGWVCFLGPREDWDGPLIEFYPRTVTLAHEDGSAVFKKLKREAHGAGGHVNISVPISRGVLEAKCDELGLLHSWREHQSLLEVWPEDEVLIEIVSSGSRS
jgi:hypothetical protein